MAKKILAVVLAVMMAVSAMAISVAADTIPLYKTSTSQSSTWGFEFTIPIFTQYGWGTQYDGFELVLPENVSSQLTTSDYKYYITVNGQRFDLKPSYAAGEVEDGVDANGDKKYKTYAAPKGLEHAETHEANWNLDTDTYKQYVFFGAFVHSYFEDGQHNEQWTTVPQTQSFGATTSIKVGIEFDGNAWDQTWVPFNGFKAANSFGNEIPYTDAKSFFTDFYSPECYAQFITYDGESSDFDDLPGYAAVPNSVTYMSYWNPVQTGGNNDAVTSTAQDFVSGDLYDVLYQNSDKDHNYSADNDFTTGVYAVSNPLTWDHTLENRAKIFGYAGDHAELVVELDKPLNGIATYTLYTRAADSGQYTNYNGLWWNYNTKRIYVDSKTIDGPTDELRFTVPLEMLYDSNGYGNYNSEFVIVETIGLYHRVFNEKSVFAVTSVGGDSGEVGDISWDIKAKRDPVTGLAWAKYKGEYINYAAGGTAFPKTVDGKSNPNYYSAVKADKIYLDLPEVEDSEPANDDEVKTPTEPADGANDPDSGDDMSAGETDNTPAEKNPETGIALAIVPMLVAAAAAVVSKKH